MPNQEKKVKKGRDEKGRFLQGHQETWRPPKYKTAKELQEKIDEYFKSGFNTREVIISIGGGKKQKVKIPVLTITGLVLFLGFADKSSFYDLEKNQRFSHSIKKARTFIEKEYEEQIQLGNPAGAIFALKNFGWSDVVEQKHSGSVLVLPNTIINKNNGRNNSNNSAR